MSKKEERQGLFWPIVIGYLFHVLMFFILAVFAADIDNLADIFDGGHFFNCVPPVVFCVGVMIVLCFVRDCEWRYRYGCWGRGGMLTPRSWLFALSVWGGALILCYHYFRTGRETVDGITWRYAVSNGNAIIGRGRHKVRASISILTTGDLTVPSTLGGYPVTGIGEYAFHRCKRLTSVTIPNGVKWIGAEAFNGCDDLRVVFLPDSLTHIQYEAFRDCRNLSSVKIPANTEYIDETAFGGTPFLDHAPDALVVSSGIAYKWKGRCPEEVKIPEGVTRIFDRAFERCAGVKSVVVANSVTNIGGAAFHGCAGLTSVTLGDCVASIGSNAFYACFKLSSISIPRSLTSVGEDAFRGSPIKTVYVEKGDAERVKELLRGKGFDVDRAAFVERDGVQAFSHSGEVDCGPRRPVEMEYEKEKQHED